MEIRILGSKDAVAFKEVRLEALKAHPEAFSSSFEEEKDGSIEKFADKLNSENAFTFGAFIEGRLVGVVALLLEKKNKIKHRANIGAMYVNPEVRESGVGKALMLAAIDQANEIEGIEQLALHVTSNNTPAKKLYKSLGFKTYGVEHSALKVEETYFDVEMMELFL
ncbi:GNAT family N-acetyltransferase [Bacillus massilinigeriensis]|uniref:GNAT family N-acetyltransferase n=1 Tax=Bacillus massilionigeriensis TaxID=1805475 RepID=UPI00096AFCA0|nr:GNAT family N-acetyltransferase [Bacillus massilionigeriensis]